MTVPAIIAGGASILGGLFGSNSAKEQNEEERKWQEHMASTQYQRAVQDMRMAGLNPAMLYGKGPMSSAVQSGARMDEGVGVREGVRGASAAFIQALGVQEMKARIADLNSAAAAKDADAKLKNMEANAVDQRLYMDYQDWAGRSGNGPGEWDQQTWGRTQLERARADIAESLARARNLDATAAEAWARKALTEIEKDMLENKRSFSEAWKKYWDQVGVYGAYIEVGSKTFRDVAGSLGLANIGRKLLNPGMVSGGAASAKQSERMRDVFELNNNQSDMIGR